MHSQSAVAPGRQLRSLLRHAGRAPVVAACWGFALSNTWLHTGHAPPQVRRRLLHPHNQLLASTYNSLAVFLSAAERWVTAAAAWGRFVEIMEAAFPPNSLVLAHQYMKHGSMLHQAVDPVPALRLQHKSARILELHYGDPMMGYEENVRLSDAVPTLDQLK